MKRIWSRAVCHERRKVAEQRSRESLNKWKLCTQSECYKQTDNTLGRANDAQKKPMMKEELVVTSAIAQTILQALEIL